MRRSGAWRSDGAVTNAVCKSSRHRLGSGRQVGAGGPFCIASTSTNLRWKQRLSKKTNMEHADLIAELPLIEKMTAMERIQLAKQRRASQLMRWQEREQKEVCHAEAAESVGRERKRKPRVQFSSGTVLLEATSRHDIQEVSQMLANGADPNCHNEDGLTALHQCAIDNDNTIMQLLIEHGANVNARDTELWTPLHAAACCGHILAMQVLMKNGAELLAVNSDGNMPYDICDEESALDYIETEMANRGITQEDIDEERLCNERRMLEDMQAMHARGESLDVRDKGGATPLHAACASGYYSVVEFLLECGSWVHVRDNDGWQPIHAAACWAQPDIIELLVQFGADINARTDSGETPLDVCEDDTTRSVLLALLVEVHRRRLLTFARDSRRMSKRKKPCSKFESPAPVVSSNQDSRFSSTRSAVRRMSIRDRCGVTLARLEARREAAVMRSWSFGESDKNQDKSQPSAVQSSEGDAALADGVGADDGAKTTADSPRTKAENNNGKQGGEPFHSLPTKLSPEKRLNSRGKNFWEKLYSASAAEASVENPSEARERMKSGDSESKRSSSSTPTKSGLSPTSQVTPSRRKLTVDERRKGSNRPKAVAPKVPNAAAAASASSASEMPSPTAEALLKTCKRRTPTKTAKISRLNCCVIS